MENAITKAEVEKLVTAMVQNLVKQSINEYALSNETRMKELSLIERIVRVEEELKSLREMSEIKFKASDDRMASLLREMNARFEAMNKQFKVIQWMFGIFVGIPFFTIAVIQLLKFLN